MARLALDRHSTAVCHQVDGVPRQTRIMNNARLGTLLQKDLGQQADEIVPFDETSFFIEEKTPVKIAVPGKSDIRAMPDNRIGRHGTIFRQQRVGDAVGKSSRPAHDRYAQTQRADALKADR